MNIYEALEAGSGKATLKGDIGFYVKQEKGVFVWRHTEIYDYFREVLYIDLKRNDWIPVVPRETIKHKEVFENINWTRETLLDYVFARINSVDIDSRKPLMKITVEWEL